MASKSGLASLSEGRSDIHKIDPRKLLMKNNWNVRDMNDPANIEHVDMLAKSIAEVGVKEPLTVFWEDGKAWVEDGHCRLLAAIRAIEVYKAELKLIPVKSGDQYANEADRIFSQTLRNSGKRLSDLEQAKNWKRLIDLGWQQGDIAKRAGISGGRVSQILSLLTLPEPVKAMVVAQQVSPTVAMQTVKAASSGAEAEKQLKAGMEVAKSEGKTKVTSTHMEATGTRQPNIKTAVIDAFEYSDINDAADDVVVITMPADKFQVLREILKL